MKNVEYTMVIYHFWINIVKENENCILVFENSAWGVLGTNEKTVLGPREKKKVEPAWLGMRVVLSSVEMLTGIPECRRLAVSVVASKRAHRVPVHVQRERSVDCLLVGGATFPPVCRRRGRWHCAAVRIDPASHRAELMALVEGGQAALLGN
jgi:hypothetical protein